MTDLNMIESSGWFLRNNIFWPPLKWWWTINLQTWWRVQQGYFSNNFLNQEESKHSLFKNTASLTAYLEPSLISTRKFFVKIVNGWDVLYFHVRMYLWSNFNRKVFVKWIFIKLTIIRQTLFSCTKWLFVKQTHDVERQFFLKKCTYISPKLKFLFSTLLITFLYAVSNSLTFSSS